MSRIPVRFVATILTFVLGVVLVWGLNAHRRSAPYTPARTVDVTETPKAKTTTATIPTDISEDERKEWYGYGADGIKCRVSFEQTAWVPRQSVILKVEFENATDKDIAIPSAFDLQIISKDVERREYASSFQWFYSRDWFDIRNGEPVSMFSGYFFSSDKEYYRLQRQSFVLHAGETKRLQSNISRFAWNDHLSSIIGYDNRFIDIVPVGEYEFLMRIRTPKWIIVSNRTDIRVE